MAEDASRVRESNNTGAWLALSDVGVRLDMERNCPAPRVDTAGARVMASGYRRGGLCNWIVLVLDS